jgi:hypothetical protein
VKLISLRRPNADPATSAFADLTHEWLEEMRRDYRRTMGDEYDGGNGVLFASDVLVALHGAEASWEKFDVDAFVAWIGEHAPAFDRVMPMMLADLATFTSFLALFERISWECAEKTEERFRTSVGLPPPNRQERRALRAARRRRTN